MVGIFIIIELLNKNSPKKILDFEIITFSLYLYGQFMNNKYKGQKTSKKTQKA